MNMDENYDTSGFAAGRKLGIAEGARIERARIRRAVAPLIRDLIKHAMWTRSGHLLDRATRAPKRAKARR